MEARNYGILTARDLTDGDGGWEVRTEWRKNIDKKNGHRKYIRTVMV